MCCRPLEFGQRRANGLQNMGFPTIEIKTGTWHNVQVPVDGSRQSVDPSDIDRMSFRIVSSFHQSLAQSRVDVHIAGDLSRGQFHHLRDSQFRQ